MSTDYKVDDLIYDASIYNGINANLVDLQFYKWWLPKITPALSNPNARCISLNSTLHFSQQHVAFSN